MKEWRLYNGIMNIKRADYMYLVDDDKNNVKNRRRSHWEIGYWMQAEGRNS